MVRSSLLNVSDHHTDSIPLGIGLFFIASAVVALCANHTRRVSRKEANKDGSFGRTDKRFDSSEEDHYQEKFPPRSPLRSPKQLITTISGHTDKRFDSSEEDHYQEKFAPRSPLRSPKQLITTISNKAMNSLVVNHKKGGGGHGGGGGKAVEEGFGEGGLWQKEILMGEKCQPPEFSGVIFYDYDGHQVSEFPPRSPRSPRVSPLPDFTFPAIKESS
ncbi:uncharacterized protein LOC112522800 [Cynara cardunculus var. scolymus]|uniref:Transmembrane protein n=1 Tax=Cynara cardunculus var. scolymus TaxID=59895 RepID=A0A103XV87_CYNCS|nr:uncharacterized protein LOC112522800 [Cynara cardunculus var. scolymus]KVH97455.1 hypothetical protein Ccrd_000388 [Cynara cardunculus var. scolymus]